MADLNKVIIGLECRAWIDDFPCEKCSYHMVDPKPRCDYHQLFEDAVILLRKQEPVAPSGDVREGWRCSKCDSILNHTQKYCCECGQAILWRD